jgi:hypothetical protein
VNPGGPWNLRSRNLVGEEDRIDVATHDRLGSTREENSNHNKGSPRVSSHLETCRDRKRLVVWLATAKAASAKSPGTNQQMRAFATQAIAFSGGWRKRMSTSPPSPPTPAATRVALTADRCAISCSVASGGKGPSNGSLPPELCPTTGM